MWQFSSELDEPSDQNIHCVKRQSVCELEGDATVDGLFELQFSCTYICLVFFLMISLVKEFFPFGSADIINQQFIMYTSLSQTRSDVRMVQSLIPIWEVCSCPIYSCFIYNTCHSFGDLYLHCFRMSMKGLGCVKQLCLLILANRFRLMF